MFTKLPRNNEFIKICIPTLQCKPESEIKAWGISTHYVEGVLAAAEIPGLDVIHPIINLRGIGIQGGTVDDMLLAIRKAFTAGKGIYAMKALGGGNLLNCAEEALNFVMGIPEVASVAVGMQSVEEVEFNVNLFEGKPVSRRLRESVDRQPRRLHIEDWCQGCGDCLNYCSAGALSILSDKVLVDQGLCRLCGYCSRACPHFCIKVV